MKRQYRIRKTRRGEYYIQRLYLGLMWAGEFTYAENRYSTVDLARRAIANENWHMIVDAEGKEISESTGNYLLRAVE